ncbi:hypothetical protein SAMN05444722_2530 [Rhodovulum sp. ES.010]|uniref:hypothetical protein n=1 Tax=Rhodovulum sp. ES.010 TaxID=1882821 RepID=UPI00092A9B86|nr:hypothetical protein [Rhodovulum sp. ES.010]SIO48384.1 hypothetical protein SAMN05444722_2530 [Rhodovulum sp. ES.010]
MTRRFLIALIAGALALTPVGAAPARADDDLAKALLGAAALFVIVKEIEDNRKDRKKAQRVERFGGRHAHRRPAPRVIPARCIRRVETPNGWGRVAVERCLNRAGVRGLPRRCEIALRGPRDGYGLRCLARAGYRVEGRRD